MPEMLLVTNVFTEEVPTPLMRKYSETSHIVNYTGTMQQHQRTKTSKQYTDIID
jgi:hypothetical protein